MSTAYQELLKRQAVEREELLDRERRENTTVTIQHNSNRDSVPGPFIVEIIFPDNLKLREKTDFARDLDLMLSQLLTNRGYGVSWLQPKDEVPTGNSTT